MKRENINQAIYLDNMITRFEKVIENNSFMGLSAIEIADLITEVGFDKLKPVMELRVEEMKSEIEKL